MWETIVLPALMGLIGHNLKQLHDSFIDSGVDKWSEFETKFNSTFEEYYQTVYNHYKDVPYLLNADVKVPLLEIYQPSFLIDHRMVKKEVLTDSLDKVLAKGNHIWIDGHGGIGKTTMLKYFLLHRLTEKRQTGDMRIPVYVELRRYNEDKFRKEHFVDFLYTLMQSENFRLELQYFEHMVEQGRFVFLLDAFDEVHSEFQGKLAYQLIDFVKQYPGNAVIISSRHLINHTINHPQFLRLETQGLEQDQAVSLIEKIDVTGTRLSEEIKEEFVVKLRDESFFKTYQSFIANPILLLLMLKTFSSNKNFPKEKAKFLLESYDYLYKEHDKNKMVSYNDREFKTSLNQETLKRVLSSFCFELYFHHSGHSYELSKHQLTDVLREVKEYEAVGDFEQDDFLHDLTTCLSVLYREGDNYLFVHNVFKEFFAAYYLYQEYSSDELSAFFREAILEGRTDWRVIQTTLDYFAELDTIYQKSHLDLEVILPLLTTLDESRQLDAIDSLIAPNTGLSIIDNHFYVYQRNNLLNEFFIVVLKRFGYLDEVDRELWSDVSIQMLISGHDIMSDQIVHRVQNFPIASKYKEYHYSYMMRDLIDKLQSFQTQDEAISYLNSNSIDIMVKFPKEEVLSTPWLKAIFVRLLQPELDELLGIYYKLKAQKEEQSRRLSRRLRR